MNPEILTHVQEEQYTRPHAGTGEGSPNLTPPLNELRQETNNWRRPPGLPKPSLPQGYHIIEGEKPRPMTVHAPRYKDMDPTNPRNLKMMKPKGEEYKPYPHHEGSSLITWP